MTGTRNDSIHVDSVRAANVLIRESGAHDIPAEQDEAEAFVFAVIPAKAGTHERHVQPTPLGSRLRGNDAAGNSRVNAP